MRLFVSPTSPYARAVLVLIHEKQAVDRVEVTGVDPWSDPAELQAVNPTGKVPALVTDQGWGLAETWAILDYLDAVLPGSPLTPPDGPARWASLRRAALGHGLIDAAYGAVFERRRPAAHQSPAAIDRHLAAIDRLVPALDALVPAADTAFDRGAVVVACALAYLDLRHGALEWRGRGPALADWFARIAARPSITGTTFG